MWTSSSPEPLTTRGAYSGSSGTAELQLGIHHVDTFPAKLERKWRHAEREYTSHRGICFPTWENAELELGGPRGGHRIAELELGGFRGGGSRAGATCGAPDALTPEMKTHYTLRQPTADSE